MRVLQLNKAIRETRTTTSCSLCGGPIAILWPQQSPGATTTESFPDLKGSMEGNLGNINGPNNLS